MKKSEALVTGGAGFIGSHLVERLIKKHYKVTVIDDLSSGDLKNLKSVKNKIKFIKLDLSRKKNLKKKLKNISYVFHLAGLSKAAESIKKPKKYYRANVTATLNLLNLVKDIKIKKFIYTASASCYGNAKEIPTSEKAKIYTLTPYGFTKWKSEQLVMKYAKNYKFPAISLRLFNIYGPRIKVLNSYSAVINVFLKQKKENKPLTIVGKGQQSRSFVYITDAVNAIIKAATSKINNEIFNVGAGKPVKIIQIAKLLNTKMIYISKRKGDPNYSYPDVKKIKKMLNWRPKISIKKGISILLKKNNL